MCFHFLQYKICGVYWDTCYTNAIIWWSVWSWHFNEKFIPILRGGKPRHKGGLTCIMQRRQHPMFVKRITQINECWFQIWQKWFLLFSWIIQFLLHLDTMWGFVSNKSSSPYCEDGIMGMFLEVLTNNPILANIDHLMQFVCFRERNLIYGNSKCSISNMFGNMHITRSEPKHGTKHFFVTWETLNSSIKMVSSNFPSTWKIALSFGKQGNG